MGNFSFNSLVTYGLNPCFTGICSLRSVRLFRNNSMYSSLNPCFTGICSLRFYILPSRESNPAVLILVLLEYAL